MKKGEPHAGTASAGALASRACVRLLVLLAVWAGLLFWAAGTLSWARGWGHVGLWMVTMVSNLVILLRVNPVVVAVRMTRPRAGAGFEKVMLPMFILATLAIPIVAGLDVVRYVSHPLPLWWMWPGMLLHAAGDAVMVWAMVANPYLSGEVRIQTERGHRVIAAGPYAIIRHPMYAGLILILAGIPLVLGSSWASLPAGTVVLLLVIRMSLEDRLLRRDLPGYEAYVLTTRHRLIPGVW